MDTFVPVADEAESAVREPADALDRRIEKLRAWLEEQAPECFDEQAHLQEGSRERVYWHYGYMIALRDLRRLMTDRDGALN